jgi:hypothetical protein
VSEKTSKKCRGEPGGRGRNRTGAAGRGRWGRENLDNKKQADKLEGVYVGETGVGAVKKIHASARTTAEEAGVRNAAGICEHNHIRHQCKECVGPSICEHNHQRNQCQECGVVGICEHNCVRNQCKQCVGASICEHNFRKSRCKECRQKQD